MTVFNQANVDHLNQPMFFGEELGIARFDTYKHSQFEKLTEKQLSFFWRPEEIDVSRDAIDYSKLSEAEQHVFTANLKYQTLLDSVQGRAPSVAFLPIVSDTALENWIETWSFSETIHSRSYTHIMRNVYNDPSKEFDNIVSNQEIMKRASVVTKHYDELIAVARKWNDLVETTNWDKDETLTDIEELLRRKCKEKLYLTMMAVNILEAIRFYVSFACSFNFAENQLMEGNAKIIKLIARDEALHLKGTQYILQQWHRGKDDPDMHDIAEELRPEATQLFLDAVKQEKSWAEYLFSFGSIRGLSYKKLCEYIEYVADHRMRSVGLDSPFQRKKENPLPWMQKWLNSDAVQIAPQEAEISSYLINQVDQNVDVTDLSKYEY
ncbi:MAG: ribonucleotide-diphosphate reductase subunit beta [Acidobacteria bacterium]|nr:ribonucleotide-diphosphate reductase subunit beta [Acidobacteriota bacterium]|tara:strand:- start:5563 stop:6702 length:1140 start_codon:yes stop_codon:yes gene_type:complete